MKPTRWKAPKDMPLKERLEHYTDKTGDCWRWLGHTNDKGYGRINWKGTKLLAHRAWWETVNDPLGTNRVDHLCRNRWCVNPDHLEIATQAENVQRGDLAKLIPEEVTLIRRWYAERTITQALLARFFGVSLQSINRIVNRQTWQNI